MVGTLALWAAEGLKPSLRGGTGEGAEVLDEVGLVVKSLFQGSVKRTMIPLQEADDLLEAGQTGEALGADANPFPEFPFQLPLAQTQLSGYTGQVKRWIGLQEADGFADGSIWNAGS